MAESRFFRVTGRVQGVFFRASTQTRAQVSAVEVAAGSGEPASGFAVRRDG